MKYNNFVLCGLFFWECASQTANYLIFVVVNKGYGENSYRGYIFDKDLILDIIQNLKKLKKQNKDKHSVKDEFNNRYDDKKVYLSPKFLETAIYRIDDTYYVKTREELNGKYDFWRLKLKFYIMDKSKVLVMLDNGHGSNTTGKRSPVFSKEM